VPLFPSTSEHSYVIMNGSTVGKSVLILSIPLTMMFVIVPSVLSLQVAPESVYASSCSTSTFAEPSKVITGGVISGGGEGLGGGGNGGGMIKGGGDGGGGGAGLGGNSTNTFRGGRGGGLGANGGGKFLGGGDKITGGGDASTIFWT